ncbi:MAG: hypothetical protein J0L92_12515 [Deltaproteobacteria bacterium]|nr:hypothetical protein [Deltaproteobacteria bacterium]
MRLVDRALVLFLLLGAGCGEPREAVPPAERPAIVAIDVRDANVTELVGQLSRALAMPVRVDTEAVPLTRCARVTVVTPPGTSRVQVVSLAREVLAGAALSLTEAGDHLVIARIEDADPPADCPRIPRACVEGEVPIELPPPSVEPPPPMDGVRWLSENTYEVDPQSATFEGGPTQLMTQARIIPHTESGEVVGLRLYGVRRGSVLGSLGFQNGDTITHIDGQPVTGLDMVLESYARHRDFQRITVDVTRRGQPMTLTYVRLTTSAPTPRAPTP